jgi:hypothetical protein
MGIRDKVFAANDIESRVVDVPEWDVKLELRTPTVLERGELIAKFMREEGTLDVVAMNPLLVVMCTHDPDTGDRVFTADDIDGLLGKSAAVMERLGEICLELSGLQNAAERLTEGKDVMTSTPNSATSSP